MPIAFEPSPSKWSRHRSKRQCGGTIDGFKLRELFVRPHAEERQFFYGVNFEFSVNRLYWEPRWITSEVRPILGVQLHPIDIIINPIVDTGYTGGSGNLAFNPAERIAYNFNDKWAIAAEEYDGFGTFHKFLTLHDQFHETWAVMDHNIDQSSDCKVDNISSNVQRRTVRQGDF